MCSPRVPLRRQSPSRLSSRIVTPQDLRVRVVPRAAVMDFRGIVKAEEARADTRGAATAEEARARAALAAVTVFQGTVKAEEARAVKASAAEERQEEVRVKEDVRARRTDPSIRRLPPSLRATGLRRTPTRTTVTTIRRI